MHFEWLRERRTNRSLLRGSVDSEPLRAYIVACGRQSRNLGLTGTKFGCGMALCGAFTVHLAKWGEPTSITNVRLDQ
jgi:xanthine dehydrogenase iron-sulfur cluster and FAD-binding subunit A